MSGPLPIRGIPLEGEPLGWSNTRFDCECGHRTVVTHPANMRAFNICSKCERYAPYGILLNTDGEPAEVS